MSEVHVVVVMATFNPDISRFRIQVESIRQQTFTDWTCVVSDDGSAPSVLAQIAKALEADPRFVLRAHTDRVGFYRNFERALHEVPDGATHVALCDQDDYWYAWKLDTLLHTFGPCTMLAYADLRVVDIEGRVLSPTYWGNRRNNHTDLRRLMLANTVTGAASVFRAELLSIALPFPSERSTSFHDHWLALVALSRGEVAYVPEPLHDYVQHDQNVIGHAEGKRSRPLVSTIGRARLFGLAAAYERAGEVFREECMELDERAKLLTWRKPETLRPGAERDLAIYIDLGTRPSSFLWFAFAAVLSFINDASTLGQERRMFLALLWSKFHRLSEYSYFFRRHDAGKAP